MNLCSNKMNPGYLSSSKSKLDKICSFGTLTNMRQKACEWQLQTHPYPPFIPEGAEVLLLGSAPPFRFCTQVKETLRKRDFDYYYGSSSNLFWEILFGVFEPENLAELDRLRKSESNDRKAREEIIAYLQSFLARYKMALADILSKFMRCGESAADYQLQVLEYQDLVPLIAKHETLKAICCTSKNRVFYWLWEYLELQEKTGFVELGQDREGFYLINREKPFRERFIRVDVLPSPSARGIMRYANKDDFLRDCRKFYRAILLPLFS